jgi:hypothetical protein
MMQAFPRSTYVIHLYAHEVVHAGFPRTLYNFMYQCTPSEVFFGRKRRRRQQDGVWHLDLHHNSWFHSHLRHQKIVYRYTPDPPIIKGPLSYLVYCSVFWQWATTAARE